MSALRHTDQLTALTGNNIWLSHIVTWNKRTHFPIPEHPVQVTLNVGFQSTTQIPPHPSSTARRRQLHSSAVRVENATEGLACAASTTKECQLEHKTHEKLPWEKQ